MSDIKCLLPFNMRDKKFLGVFDFDQTIIAENSDVVVRDLLPKPLTDSIQADGWTAYMRQIFTLLHNREVTQDNIRQAIVCITAVPYFILFIKKLKEMNCDIIIISDSNTYFIDEWLKSNDIKHCVDKVYSNLATFVDGRLDITEFHFQDWCSLSEKNLCKGFVLEKHLEDRKKLGINYNSVFYVGDGRNDLCPSLKLGENDFVFPRFGYPLLDKIKGREDIRALVVPWTNTNEILAILKAVNT